MKVFVFWIVAKSGSNGVSMNRKDADARMVN